METPARKPEHEPARRRLLFLTLGSRHYPGPWSAPCSLLPAALACLQARSRSAALVGFPHLFWPDPGCQAPGSTADNDPGPQPRKGANAKETGISRGHLPSLLLEPLLRSPCQAGTPALLGLILPPHPLPEVNQPYLPVRFSLENT